MIRGGQGRSEEDVRESAAAVALSAAIFLLTLVVAAVSR